MRPNPPLDIQQAITELGVGEALVSFLDPKGIPTPTERVWMFAPGSRIGLATADEIARIRAASLFTNKYDQAVDRESAYELLQRRAEESAAADKNAQDNGGLVGMLKEALLGSTGPRGGRREGLVEQVAKTEARRITRNMMRGVLGSLLGGNKKR